MRKQMAKSNFPILLISPYKGKAESIKNDFRSNMKNKGHKDKKYLIFVCTTSKHLKGQLDLEL